MSNSFVLIIAYCFRATQRAVQRDLVLISVDNYAKICTRYWKLDTSSDGVHIRVVGQRLCGTLSAGPTYTLYFTAFTNRRIAFDLLDRTARIILKLLTCRRLTSSTPLPLLLADTIRSPDLRESENITCTSSYTFI